MLSAFDIGGSKIACGHYTDELECVNQDKTETPIHDYARFLDCIVQMAHPESSAIGVSIAGAVDVKKGTVEASNIPCLSGQPLARDIQQRTGADVFLINDANAFALAEANCGAGKDCASVLGIILGTGIGGACVFNGRLYEGANGIAGEWGHSQAIVSGTDHPMNNKRCGCGQLGCIDLYGGARGLEALYQSISGETATTYELFERWQLQEVAAQKCIDVYTDILGKSLAGVINVVDPNIIVVGGGLSENEKLIQLLQVKSHQLSLLGALGPQFKQGVCGGGAGLLGAAIQAKNGIRRVS